MERCSLCPGRHKCLPPSGPLDLGRDKILFIGEAPGWQEERDGRIFVGKTGQELDRGYLPLATLRRENITIINAIACLPTSTGGKLDPKRAADLALLDSCTNKHLYSFIERTQPRLLVPLGAFACRAVNPDIDLELHHGFPRDTPWGIPAFPMYHPASGLHEPKKMLHLRNDWVRLKHYLKGTLELPVDPHPNPDYAEVEDEVELGSFFLDHTKPLACDTEGSKRRGPYCLTYSNQAGTGRLIRAERRDLLGAFQAALDRWEGPILFHNWLYDYQVVTEMGLRFPRRLMVDTMVRAFHLGNLPQGLKSLGWRELGVEMQDFEDLVKPYSRQLAINFLLDAYTNPYPWSRREPELVRQKDGELKLYKPQALSTKLKRFFTDLRKNPEGKDVFAAWENWEEHHEEMEGVCGEWPGLDIRHAPFEKILPYACRDSDVLFRVWEVLERMRRNVRRRPQERWRDVA